MTDRFAQYDNDLNRLIKTGGDLVLSMQHEINPKSTALTSLSDDEKKKLPSVKMEYQSWYSESLVLVKQLIPDRADDFISYYSPKPSRKDITHANYTVSDYLRGLTVTMGGGTVTIVDPKSALDPLVQQFNIVTGIKQRFKSLLFDIRTLAHADLLDDEIASAKELNAKGFQRAAGAVAGVVLEAHLGEVCSRAKISIKKKDPSIADYNEALKAANKLDIPGWRFIQHLADIRNKCDHKKLADPSSEEVNELILGVAKVTKTVF
ncbi:hypothetical protein [Methylobacterium sp. GC_Met_2]|uniref:hypothetical protein n=1 Tax=Methylobacterium sp. GC_Met_2 TaxID=2937376 RepID=UPI00226B1A32|nr:hypothetical protein [Methylobacterium sp. GC_Met_2]